jgi:hypothetical protein
LSVACHLDDERLIGGRSGTHTHQSVLGHDAILAAAPTKLITVFNATETQWWRLEPEPISHPANY